MKTYFRLLSFAKPIEKFAIPYVVFTLLYVLFSSLIYPLLIPLLNTLFITDSCNPSTVVAVRPEHVLDIVGWFKFYTAEFIKIQGLWWALKFICGVIVVTMVVGNLFRYLGARTMENLRLHTLLNLRSSVFNNVMDMHLGYFNNQRKGDIISKKTTKKQKKQKTKTTTKQKKKKEPFQ